MDVTPERAFAICVYGAAGYFVAKQAASLVAGFIVGVLKALLGALGGSKS